jgi:hypothetical protein
MTQALLPALVAVGMIVLSAASKGGPPMITDDPDTPGAGKWEINIASVFERRPGEYGLDFPALDLNYGVGDHIQLKLEVTFTGLKRTGRGWLAGLGNALVGVKGRFLDEAKSGVSMSIYPQMEWNLAHASARRGLVESGTHVLLPLEMSRRAGWLLLNVEIGDALSFNHGGEWFYGLLASVPVDKKVEFLAELYGVSKFDGNGQKLLLNFGVRRKVVEHVTLMLSVGHDLHAIHGDARSLVAFIGIQLNP